MTRRYWYVVAALTIVVATASVLLTQPKFPLGPAPLPPEYEFDQLTWQPRPSLIPLPEYARWSPDRRRAYLHDLVLRDFPASSPYSAEPTPDIHSVCVEFIESGNSSSIPYIQRTLAYLNKNPEGGCTAAHCLEALRRIHASVHGGAKRRRRP
jgi:hypothetical protein